MKLMQRTRAEVVSDPRNREMLQWTRAEVVSDPRNREMLARIKKISMQVTNLTPLVRTAENMTTLRSSLRAAEPRNWEKMRGTESVANLNTPVMKAVMQNLKELERNLNGVEQE